MIFVLCISSLVSLYLSQQEALLKIPTVIQCFPFFPLLSCCIGSYLNGRESRHVAANGRCRQQKSIRQSESEIEEVSYRFFCLFLVNFSELVWFTPVRYYFEPSRDEHILIVNEKSCLHSCFFPWFLADPLVIRYEWEMEEVGEMIFALPTLRCSTARLWNMESQTGILSMHKLGDEHLGKTEN